MHLNEKDHTTVNQNTISQIVVKTVHLNTDLKCLL